MPITSASLRQEAFFLGADGQQREVASAGDIFCVHSWPSGRLRGAVVVLPPLLEEMNNCRRDLTVLRRRLAEAGCAVLQPDLQGTGDAMGDLSQATLADWQANVDLCCRFFAGLHGLPPVGLAIRAGVLLAEPRMLQSWICLQPVWQGARQIDEWVRLRRAGLLLAGTRANAATLRDTLCAPGTVNHWFGYPIPGDLASALEQRQASRGQFGTCLEVQCSGSDLASVEAGNQAVQDGIWVLPGREWWSSVEIPLPSQVEDVLVDLVLRQCLNAS